MDGSDRAGAAPTPPSSPVAGRRPDAHVLLLAGAASAAVGALGLLGVASRRARRLARALDVPEGVDVALPDGGVLHATVLAPDGPARGAVVFAHGWTMDRTFWAAHARAVADAGYLAVTYDQRGHGRSTRPRRDGYDLVGLGDDLAAVLDQLVPPALPVTLVGHSMGAMTILAWAGRTHPRRHRVTGAVLANTAARGVVTDALAAMTGSSSPAVHALARRLVLAPAPVPPGPLVVRAVQQLAHGEGAPAEAVALTARLLRACHPAVRVGFARQLDVLDLQQRAVALDVPALVVTGTRDRLTPPSHAERLAEDLPDARLHVLPGAGHQAPIEDVPAFTALVLAQASAGAEGAGAGA